MFTKLRQLSKNPLVKLFLLALAVSLVIWGVKIGSDRQDYVAIVGKDHYIYKTDFIRAKTNFLRNARQKYNQTDLDNTTVNQIILNGLIQKELLKVESASLGLIVGESLALEAIQNMPIFQNNKRKFDKDIFKNALAINGINASKFLNDVKDEIAVSILNSVFTPYYPSKDLIREFFYSEKQKRTIDLITIRPIQNLNIPNIKDKEIETYYSTHKNKFAIPESRDVEYIAITPDTYKSKIKSLDEELKNELAASKNAKTNEGLRAKIKGNLLITKVNKMLHNEIKIIEDEISAGSSIKEVANKYKLKYIFIEKLNQSNQSKCPKFDQFLKQTFIADENYPSETFAINKNKISSGYYILNVPKIYKTHYKSLEKSTKKSVISLIKDEQKESISKEKALKLYNLAVSEKKTLAQIAQENPNVSLREMIVDRAQNNANIRTNLLANIFSLKTKDSYTSIFKSKEPHVLQFAKVKKIQLPKNGPSAKQAQMIESQLSSYITTEINQEFLNHLYRKHKVKILPNTLKKP